MKSLERAKSFVASRSASSRGCRPVRNDTVLHSTSTTNNRVLKRSNSLCGGRPNQPSSFIKGSNSQESGDKKSTKVLTQLEAMQQKVESIDQMLHSLQELSDRCQRDRIKVPRMKNCSTCEHNAIMKVVVDIETSVKIVRNSLLFLCRCYLQERHIAVLLSIQSQIYPTLDISVRFFGIDWLHIFRVSYNLQQGVDAMAKLVINDTSTTPFADILLPSNVLRGLATIEADVSSHAEAVLHGRLSKITQEKINLEQQIQTETGNPQPLEQEAAQLDTCPKEVERSSNGRQMISDLRRKLRKAIRIMPGSSSMHGLSTTTKAGNAGVSEKIFTGLIDKRSRSHHDALWRAWYTGVQTVTIPAAASAAFSSTSLRPTSSVDCSSPSSSQAHPASTTSFSPAVSLVRLDPDQVQVLDQIYHDSIEAIDDLEEEEPEESGQNDDSFDSLTLTLTMATAPKQEFSESQL